jgi:hypothetical protein
VPKTITQPGDTVIYFKPKLELIGADEFFMLANGKTCPHCNTESLHRSHRRGKDWFFHILALRPVRCSCCCQRFYAPLKALEPREKPGSSKLIKT